MMMGRRRKFKTGDVVWWKSRGHIYYGTVIDVRDGPIYTVVNTDAFGAHPNLRWLEQFMGKQLNAVRTGQGRKRRNMASVRLWEMT